MKHRFSKSFYEICNQILDEGKDLDEWLEIESDDMFQNGEYVGGFDGIEMEFCFSLYTNNDEYWFQLSLDDITKVSQGLLDEIEVRKAYHDN